LSFWRPQSRGSIPVPSGPDAAAVRPFLIQFV